MIFDKKKCIFLSVSISWIQVNTTAEYRETMVFLVICRYTQIYIINYHNICVHVFGQNYLYWTLLHSVVLKWCRYRPGVAQRLGRGIDLLFHDRGTRRGWVVSSTPWPHFTPGKDPVPILQEAGWAPRPVGTGGKTRPHRDSIPDRPACSQSLYWLSYTVLIAITFKLT